MGLTLGKSGWRNAQEAADRFKAALLGDDL
jgi:hypothetical protein